MREATSQVNVQWAKLQQKPNTYNTYYYMTITHYYHLPGLAHKPGYMHRFWESLLTAATHTYTLLHAHAPRSAYVLKRIF